MSDYVWHPRDHEWTADCRLARFMFEQGFDDFDSLWRASVADTGWFWRAAVDDLGLSWDRPYSEVCDDSAGFPWARWFVDGEINIATNCIHRHIEAGHGGEVALIYEPDDNLDEHRRKLTFAELGDLVDRCAAAMTRSGIGGGDAVGLYAPLLPETVAAMFAAFKVGARVVPIFCGFGEGAVVDRLASCGARILFASETLHRRGRAIPTADILGPAAAALPELEEVVHLDTASWGEFLDGAGGGPEPPYATGSEHPCMVIYTSGTSGKPKGTVHTHAGVLAQVGKEVGYAFDARPGRPFFWLTDIGWMMGPWELIGCLLFRTPVVVLDGAPDWPRTGRLWELVGRHRVDTLGLSPTAVRLLAGHGDGEGPGDFDLSSLRLLGSTGELWDASSWHWFFEKVGGRRCPVMNISGGTEIMGCHLQPYPVSPLKPLSLGRGALGMDVDVFDGAGEPVVGQVGHLVCKQPAPSMTRSFLGDDARYLETYFAEFGEGVWCHGDWASVDADGDWFLHGRTDDVIKIAGKRVGPAEVESALLEHPAVAAAAAIGVHDDLKGQALVCFAIPSDRSADEEELAEHLAGRLGKPLRPRFVHLVSSLPKTRSGKILRGAIKRAYGGDPPGDLSSVENPGALDEILALAQPSPSAIT